MDEHDLQLVQRCQQQLPYITTAFEELLRRYEPLVFRACRNYLHDEHEAEEACQDAWLRVFHGLRKFEGRSTFRTWLFRIVANVCATQLAKRVKRDAHKARYAEIVADEFEHDEKPHETELDEIKGVIGEGLELLAPPDREVLVLRHVVGLSLEELSAAIGQGLSATKMRLYRAEQRLRNAYEKIVKDSKN